MAAETVKIALNIAEGANEIKYCDPQVQFQDLHKRYGMHRKRC